MEWNNLEKTTCGICSGGYRVGPRPDAKRREELTGIKNTCPKCSVNHQEKLMEETASAFEVKY